MTQVETVPTPQWQTWARENLVWILTLVPIGLAGLRVLIVSRGNPETLRALLNNIDVLSLVLGSILPNVPILVFWGYIAYLEWVRSSPQNREPKLPWPLSAWAYGPLAAVILLMDSVTFAIHIIALFIIVTVFIYRRKRGIYAGGSTTTALAALVFVLFMNSFFYNSTPWLPHEIITVKESGSEVGYVLSSDPRWTTYLAKNGPVKYVASSDVISRQICTVNDSNFARPILAIISNRVDPTPKCAND